MGPTQIWRTSSKKRHKWLGANDLHPCSFQKHSAYLEPGSRECCHAWGAWDPQAVGSMGVVAKVVGGQEPKQCHSLPEKWSKETFHAQVVVCTRGTNRKQGRPLQPYMPYLRRTARSKVTDPKHIVGVRKPLGRLRAQEEWPWDLSDRREEEEDLFRTTETMVRERTGERTEGKGKQKTFRKQFLCGRKESSQTTTSVDPKPSYQNFLLRNKIGVTGLR